MIKKLQRRSRTERGVAAVLFACASVLIFALAALGVDMGNAMNRKKENQTSSDMAALAGGAGLPTQDDTTRQRVADYLNQNQPVTDGKDKCDTSTGPVTAARLRDGDYSNGEVVFPPLGPGNAPVQEMTVYAPSTKVTFGLANAIGFTNTCVQTKATVRIGSGGNGMAPYYATSACDLGIQTLKSNAAGLSVPISVPPLANDADTNISTLNTITPSSISVTALPTDPLASVTITGNATLGAATTDKVGIFSSDKSAPQLGTITYQDNNTITFTVPFSVSSVQDVWYIRVHNLATDKWSSRSGALSLVVGSAYLSCNPDAATGNFGALDLPGWKGVAGINSTQDQLARNIAAGPKSPLSLTTYKGTPFPTGVCPAEGPSSPTVISENENSLSPNTNCVSTQPGLDSNAATDGFLSGVGNDGRKGKLDADTSKACTDLGRPSRYAGNVAGKNLNVNDDLLTCFFRNSSTTIAQAIAYTGTDALFTQDIWNSPRFALVPVFASDPPGNKTYAIQKFVAGFITDQPTGANKSNNLEVNTQTDHGLVISWQGNGANAKPKIGAIRMIFFPISALPAPPDGGPISDYFGEGKKIINLAN